MSLQPIIEEPTLPKINEKLVKERCLPEVVDYLIRLVAALQENLIRNIIQMINIQLSLVNVGVFYSNLPDLNGVYPDGTWRLIKVGDGMELQTKIAGVWAEGTGAVARWEY